jgi:hypothetical protein
MNISSVYSSTIHFVAIKTCNVIGHSWRYKDYSNFIKADGSQYDFTMARWCWRCHKRAYYRGNWEYSEKNKLDFVSDAFSTRMLNL